MIREEKNFWWVVFLGKKTLLSKLYSVLPPCSSVLSYQMMAFIFYTAEYPEFPLNQGMPLKVVMKCN